MTTHERPPTREVQQLRRRLLRERLTRQEAERISEQVIRELYDQRRSLDILKAVSSACNEAATAEEAMQTIVDQV